MSESIDLLELKERLLSQDNRATAHPIFVVFQKRRIYGVEEDYTDTYIWIEEGGSCEVDEQQSKLLDAQLLSEGFVPDNFRKVGYKDVDELVTVTFTEAAAEQFIRLNRHNLSQPFTYVESLYRNPEMRALRELLMGNLAEQLNEVQVMRQHLQDSLAAMNDLADQVEQMRGMFDDSDNTITESLENYEETSSRVSAYLAGGRSPRPKM